jgi:hypothetical protein
MFTFWGLSAWRALIPAGISGLHVSFTLQSQYLLESQYVLRSRVQLCEIFPDLCLVFDSDDVPRLQCDPEYDILLHFTADNSSPWREKEELILRALAPAAQAERNQLPAAKAEPAELVQKWLCNSGTYRTNIVQPWYFVGKQLHNKDCYMLARQYPYCAILIYGFYCLGLLFGSLSCWTVGHI